MIQLRFRRWGTSDWTFIVISGEDCETCLGILGSGLDRFHTQVKVGAEWEDLQ